MPLLLQWDDGQDKQVLPATVGSFLCGSFKPVLQLQVKPPQVFVHVADEWQSFNSEEAHSSKSEKWHVLEINSLL